MKVLIYVVIALAVIARIALRVRGRKNRSARSSARLGPFTSEVGLIASREVHERIRGRIFRYG
ncbi:MAG: hypothetical protein ABI298_03805, partial [Acidimicrobiales bacterium]